MKNFLPQLLISLVLIILWYVFSGYFESFFLLLGAASIVLVLWIGRRMQLFSHIIPIYARPRTWLYSLWLVKEICLSGWQVARIICRGNMRLSPALAWIPSQQTEEENQITMANSITLTPGTVSTDVIDGWIQLHVLNEAALRDLETGLMDKKVKQL
ncbi:MAG: hypothetical protein GC136_11525 [Alphaproteobacteria bacterium]|nr:hypothetical protein [Alphaproteobacteria bacterium]